MSSDSRRRILSIPQLRNRIRAEAAEQGIRMSPAEVELEAWKRELSAITEGGGYEVSNRKIVRKAQERIPELVREVPETYMAPGQYPMKTTLIQEPVNFGGAAGYMGPPPPELPQPVTVRRRTATEELNDMMKTAREVLGLVEMVGALAA